VALRPPYPATGDAATLHASVPVVDLLVGTPLFRRGFLARRRRGHVDLPRLEDAGVDLIGLTIATRFPNLRGSLSIPHFWSLGLNVSEQRTDMAIVEAFASRIAGWADASGGRLRLLDEGEAPRSTGVDAYIAIQGGHVLDGDVANVTRLRALGVRTFALSHVMDNELVGSGTGVHRGGLTLFGREVVAELEQQRIVVDLAHMSSRGIRDTVPLLARPFLLSHTGFAELAGRRSWRRYSARNRNVGSDDARLIAAAGGVIGGTLSTQLVGGSDLRALVDHFRFAVDLVGPDHVAIGSDFDGGLRMTFDVSGLPLLTQGLLDAGVERETVVKILGGNALRVLRAAL
jgi:microsomal dipeptidase-like Zn-dependent dipeptidase